MNNMQLAATKNWLLKPFALLLALIFNGLFIVLKQGMTEQVLAIDIILFTFIVRAAMMPLMIKQQRSTRRMTLLQPQIDKIQAKYKNKTDPESTQKMNAEIQKLYSDNKANPMSGCLPLLIQMPIIFALFEVLRNVPFYVNDIGALFKTMAGIIMDQYGYADVLSSNFASIIKGVKNFDAASVTSVMDVLQRLSRTQWATLTEQLSLTGNSTFMQAYKLQEAYNTVGFGFLTFNLSENPALTNWSILFPILSALSTFLQSFLTQRANDKRQKLVSPDGKVPQQQASMKAGPMVLIVTYFCLTVAELFISPLGLSFVSKIAPKHIQGICQGLWLTATAIGNLLIVIGPILFNKLPNLWMTWAFFLAVCLIAGIVMFGMLKWLERITSEKQ